MNTNARKLLYLNRRAPYGSSHALETLEVVLIGAAFDQEVSVLFLDDGVFQLLRGQDGGALATKTLATMLRALGDYEVQRIHVATESLAERGLTADDLIAIEGEDPNTGETLDNLVKVIDRAEVTQLLTEAEIVFGF